MGLFLIGVCQTIFDMLWIVFSQLQ